MKYIPHTKAFMIVEMIVAVAIIVLAIIGPLSAAKSSLVAASDARDYVESVYLADESLEAIRLMRDNNNFQGHSWLYGLDQCLNASGCGISVSDMNPSIPSNPNNIVSCGGSAGCELNYDRQEGLFSYKTGSSWVKSGIKRKIFIKETVADKEAEIRIDIERNRLGFPTRLYTVRAILMDWKQQSLD